MIDWEAGADRYRSDREQEEQRERPVGRWIYDEPVGYGDTSRGYQEPWMAPGPYTGRGPRGYRRQDDYIREDVCDRLTWHGYIDAGDIEVRVESGEVLLTGSIDSRRSKRLAEDVAAAVPGVADVHNRLRIRQAQQAHEGRHGPHALAAGE